LYFCFIQCPILLIFTEEKAKKEAEAAEAKARADEAKAREAEEKTKVRMPHLYLNFSYIGVYVVSDSFYETFF
jgi:hypothetical protein